MCFSVARSGVVLTLFHFKFLSPIGTTLDLLLPYKTQKNRPHPFYEMNSVLLNAQSRNDDKFL